MTNLKNFHRSQQNIIVTVLLILSAVIAIVLIGFFIGNFARSNTEEARMQALFSSIDLEIRELKLLNNNTDVSLKIYRNPNLLQKNAVLDSIKFVFYDRAGKLYTYVDNQTAGQHRQSEIKTYLIRSNRLNPILANFSCYMYLEISSGIKSSSGSVVFGDSIDSYGYNYISKKGNANEKFGNCSGSIENPINLPSNNITGCREITLAGIYTLNQSISATGTCITINADDVILDGNGFRITGIGGDVQGYGIYANGRTNITIQDFADITGFDYITGNGFSAIYLKNTDKSIIQNLIVSNSVYGIHLESGSNNNLYNITNSIASDGLFLESSSNNNLYNIATSGSTNGISIVSSSNNSFYNSISNSNNDYGILLASSSDNRFINLESYSNTINEIHLAGASTGNILIYNNSFGEIKFKELNSDITETLRFGTGQNIEIANNSASVDSTSLSALNVSANVTFYGSSNKFGLPRIYRDGKYVCNETTNPSCSNFTSLNAGKVVFNVSSWSNYSIGEGEYYHVSCVLDCPADPDSTGDYYYAGVLNGKNYYQREDKQYIIGYEKNSNIWIIARDPSFISPSWKGPPAPVGWPPWPIENTYFPTILAKGSLSASKIDVHG